MVSNRSKRLQDSDSFLESSGDYSKVIGSVLEIKERWALLPPEFFFSYDDQCIFDSDGLVVAHFAPHADNPNGVNWDPSVMRDCLTQAPEDIRFLLQELKEAKNELAKHVHTYVSCRSENCNNPIRWSKSVRGLCNSCVDDLLDKCDGYANLLEDEIADLKFNEKGSSPNREQG